MSATKDNQNKAREQLAIDRGIERARKRRESQAKRGELGTTTAGLMTSERARDAVVAKLQQYIDAAVASKAKTPPKWLKHLEYHPIKKTAEIGLRCCLDAVGANLTRNNTVIQIANSLNSSIMSEVLNSTSEGRDVIKDIANRVQSKPSSSRTKRERALYIAGKRKKKQVLDRKGKAVRDEEGNNIFVDDPAHYHWAEWDDATKVKTGGRVMMAIFEATDLFELEAIKDDATEQFEGSKRLRLTDAAEEQLASLNDFLDAQTPQFGPMFNTPYPWGPDSLGPYDNISLANLVPPVKHMSKAQEEAVYAAMKNGKLTEATEALNRLQEVPYDVNKDVVNLVEWVVENKLWDEVSSFPSLTKFPELKNMPEKKFAKLTKGEQLDFRRDQLDRRKGNREVQANLLGIKRNLDEAHNIISAAADGVDAFYLPHQWDYRGRVYHTSEFGHHNTDYLRAMFLFANKTPITRNNIKYLCLQIANTFGNGLDKRRLTRRQAWVRLMQDRLYEVGRDPTNRTTKWQRRDPETGKLVFDKETGEPVMETPFEFWASADDPLQFYAACRELFNATEHGFGYMTGLPIGLDATQSGIQVYCAMGRNLEDGQKVNLTENKEPGDLYTAVMEKAQELIDRDIEDLTADGLNPDVEEEDDDREKDRRKLLHATQWKNHKLTRKTVKRNCMTWAYSSRRWGFADQLRTDLMEPLSKQVANPNDPLTEHPFGADRGWGAAWYMAGINERAITAVVTSAADGMEFFQKLVRMLNKDNMHLQYETPLGFPVHQYYRELDKEFEPNTEQECGSCGVVTEKPEEEEEGDKVWKCPDCGAANKLKGRKKPASDRIAMPAWDRDARDGQGKATETKVNLRNYLDVVDKGKSQRAVAPNVIHSLDATILMKTVINCADNEVNDLMVVHDSFSTTIDNVQVMDWAIRQAFFDLFNEHDPYQMLLDQTMGRLTETQRDQLSADDVPTIPPRGKLDIAEVKKSPYAFS